MKINSKSFSAISLLLLFAISQCVSPIRVNSIPINQEKIYCDATIEDDFADDSVMVVLQNDASLQFRTFSEKDFWEVGCVSVTDLSTGRSASIQRQLQASSAATAANRDLLDKGLVQDLAEFHQVICLKLEQKSKANVLCAIKVLQQRADVLYAGPDYYLKLCSTTPKDAQFNEQWALSKISLPQAWDWTTGSGDVLVGVIDGQIDITHSDLDERVDRYLSRNFVQSSHESTNTSFESHATAVAGIIGAETNIHLDENGESEGIAGTCWNVTLVCLRAFNTAGEGRSSAVASAINYAEANNIPILNLSAGWNAGHAHYDQALNSVINNYSGLFVCSVGNTASNNDVVAHYPSNFVHSRLIAVGASTANDTVWEHSSYGANNVDLFAPGHNILSTVKRDTYGNEAYERGSGTSYAAPYVAGVAALLLSTHPDLTAAELKQIIMNNVDTSSAFAGKCVSGGRLNAFKAVSTDEIHSYVAISGTNKHRCTSNKCNHEEVHYYDVVVRYSAQQHKIICSGCQLSQYQSHTYRVGSTICTVCGYNSSGLEQMGVEEAICVIA